MTIFQFMSDSPFLTFFLAWILAWLIATVIGLTFSLLKVLFRGHNPYVECNCKCQVEIEESDDQS
jgi:ABC-type polysaccharide/polyol phosphate export permease